MEEEDGRPGARAVQTAASDAHGGVGALSLPTTRAENNDAVILSGGCPNATAPEGPAFIARVPHVSFLRPGWDFRTPADLYQIEEKNENVPGK